MPEKKREHKSLFHPDAFHIIFFFSAFQTEVRNKTQQTQKQKSIFRVKKIVENQFYYNADRIPNFRFSIRILKGTRWNGFAQKK